MNYCQFRNDVIKRMANAGGGGLPAEYQLVEYLRATGTQYIVTQATTADNQIIRCKFRMTSLNRARVFSSYNGSINPTALIITMVDYYAKNNYGESVTAKTPLIFAVNTIYDCTLNNNTTLTVNGTDYANKVDYGGNTTSINIMLYSQYNTTGQNLIGDMYIFTITQGDSKIIDLVPCYRKTDSKPGMYDLVTNTFYTNAGTGEFTVGRDV